MRRKHADVLGVLLSFTLLAACLLAVLLSGARIYRGLTERSQESFARRTAAQFLETRLRQTDAKDIFLGSFDGTPAQQGDTLFLREEVDGEDYLTRIYCYDGSLRELYTPADSDCQQEDGERLVAAESLTLSREADLLTASVTTDGTETQLILALPAGEDTP